MHLRDRKLKTCKLVCIHTMGSGGREGTGLMASLLCALLKFSS